MEEELEFKIHRQAIQLCKTISPGAAASLFQNLRG
jgi:hypothetical protein